MRSHRNHPQQQDQLAAENFIEPTAGHSGLSVIRVRLSQLRGNLYFRECSSYRFDIGFLQRPRGGGATEQQRESGAASPKHKVESPKSREAPPNLFAAPVMSPLRASAEVIYGLENLSGSAGVGITNVCLQAAKKSSRPNTKCLNRFPTFGLRPSDLGLPVLRLVITAEAYFPFFEGSASCA